VTHAPSFRRLAALVAAVALSSALCASQPSASAQTLQTLRVVGPPNDGYKAIYYGVASGIFRKYGLDVKPAIVSSGGAAAAALIGGSADIAFTNLIAVMQAHLRGVAIEFVSGGPQVFSDRPFTSTVVLRNSPIKSARDLAGKTVGTQSVKDMSSAAVMASVDQNGGDPHAVHLFEITGSVALPMLQDHRIDAATLIEPAVSQALATGTVRVLMHPMDAIGARVETGAFAAMKPNVEANRDTMTRFAQAMHEAQVYTNAHLPQTVDIVAGYSGVAANDVAHSIRITDAEYVRPGDLQSVINVLAKYGFIDKAFPATDIISSVALRP
jgi:NitT/TauT family transport system substrate-binding protein